MLSRYKYRAGRLEAGWCDRLGVRKGLQGFRQREKVCGEMQSSWYRLRLTVNITIFTHHPVINLLSSHYSMSTEARLVKHANHKRYRRGMKTDMDSLNKITIILEDFQFETYWFDCKENTPVKHPIRSNFPPVNIIQKNWKTLYRFHSCALSIRLWLATKPYLNVRLIYLL
jgi:hypothetical protein